MEYEEISAKYNKGDIVKSLLNDENIKYSGFLTMLGETGYDSFNSNLIVYKDKKLAQIIEHGVDERMVFIEKVMSIRREYGFTNSELLKQDYPKLLGS